MPRERGARKLTTLRPVDPPYSMAVQGILDNYPQRNGYILKLFRVFANSERFLRKGVADLLDRESPLPLRLREIVILRVTANLSCEYEWGVHVAGFGAAAELTDAQIRATCIGDSSSECWSSEESLLIQVVDEICATGRIEGATHGRFAESWTVEQQLEILALCGNYHTVCFVANTAELDGEGFGAKFPPRSP